MFDTRRDRGRYAVGPVASGTAAWHFGGSIAVDRNKTMVDGSRISLTENQLESLCAIAEAAGHEVMSVYDSDFIASHKADATPITQADLRADAVIRAVLNTLIPGIPILSEESSEIGVASSDTFFLVDPLDGTKDFLKRNSEFTVNIALIHGGQPVMGVVLAPALGELFFAAQGIGAWKRDAAGIRALQVVPWDSTRVLRVIGSRSHGSDALLAWIAKLTCEHTFVAVGSSLKFCRIAEGRADIYPRFGPTSQWDTAAAQCVLECAGGTVTDLTTGRPLIYGLDRPVLNPVFVASVKGVVS